MKAYAILPGGTYAPLDDVWFVTVNDEDIDDFEWHMNNEAYDDGLELTSDAVPGEQTDIF